jgi:hypothetical protein
MPPLFKGYCNKTPAIVTNACGTIKVHGRIICGQEHLQLET